MSHERELACCLAHGKIPTLRKIFENIVLELRKFVLKNHISTL